MTTDEKIRDRLWRKGKIDALDAARLFGCFSLPQVINRLRAHGVHVRSVTSKRKVRLDGKSMVMDFTGYELKEMKHVKFVQFRTPLGPKQPHKMELHLDSDKRVVLSITRGDTVDNVAKALRSAAELLEE